MRATSDSGKPNRTLETYHFLPFVFIINHVSTDAVLWQPRGARDLHLESVLLCNECVSWDRVSDRLGRLEFQLLGHMCADLTPLVSVRTEEVLGLDERVLDEEVGAIARHRVFCLVSRLDQRLLTV